MTNNQTSSVSSNEAFNQGLVEIFTGDGKGKTSAALGTALRALGHKLRVHIIFFMKGDYPYNERLILTQIPNVSFSCFGQDYLVDPKNIKPKEKEQAKKGLDKAHEVIHSSSYDVVILDEINVAVGWKLLEIGEVLQLIKDKPKKVELILTGRYADPKLIDAADLVTNMVKVKHPYDKGINARGGIDY
jgi:cob(I)alamin adenosyltransferase